MRRKRFVDWARGVAVIGMVLWHTADGWIEPSLRTGTGWSLLRFIGGFPAACFLFLAGLGAALAARDQAPPHAQGLRDALARGLEIMLLGYALRLQTWLVDGGGLLRVGLVRAWLPLVIGYVCLWRALHHPRPRRFALVGLSAVVLSLVQVPFVAPGRLPRLLQVDVLQAIGACLVLLALGERSVRLLHRPKLAVALGLATAAATEPVGALLPGFLPVPVAAYLGKFAVAAGQPSPALFPLLPWLSYACFGAAVGAMMRRRDDAFVVHVGVAGAALSLVTSEAHAPIQHLMAVASFSVHPIRVLFRVGLVLTLLLVGWAWVAGTRGRLVETLGRASLRVYWAHLLVAYGALSTAWHKRLGIGKWSALAALLLAAMWLLACFPRRAVPRPTSEAST